MTPNIRLPAASAGWRCCSACRSHSSILLGARHLAGPAAALEGRRCSRRSPSASHAAPLPLAEIEAQVRAERRCRLLAGDASAARSCTPASGISSPPMTASPASTSTRRCSWPTAASSSSTAASCPTTARSRHAARRAGRGRGRRSPACARNPLAEKPSSIVPDNDPAKNIFYWKDIARHGRDGRPCRKARRCCPSSSTPTTTPNPGGLPVGGVTHDRPAQQPSAIRRHLVRAGRGAGRRARRRLVQLAASGPAERRAPACDPALPLTG